MSKRVALALGSGGARGYAHIGVIEALEKRGYEIVAISGSSMGALIGGLYASGGLKSYKEWVLGLDVYELVRLLDFSFSKDGIIKGDRVFLQIKEFVGDQNIEDLPIPFTAVATNLDEQRSIWFQNGSLLDAIRASIAIPTVFTPKKIAGELYIDGGILNPIPTVPLLSTSFDLLIAVDAQSSTNEKITLQPQSKDEDLKDKIISYLNENILKKDGTLNSFKIVSKSLEMMQNKIIKYELATHEPDIIINIPRQVADFYDFHKAKELIAFGEQRASDVIDNIDNI